MAARRPPLTSSTIADGESSTGSSTLDHHGESGAAEALAVLANGGRVELGLESALVAVVDRDGAIVQVDERWQTTAAERGLELPSWKGGSYLAACDAAKDDVGARTIADGVRAVLAGERDRFAATYPCHDPAGEERWFRVLVSPLAGDPVSGAVIVHVDVSSWLTTRRTLERRSRHQSALAALRRLDLRGLTALLSGLPPIAIEALDVSRCEIVEWPCGGAERSVAHHGAGPSVADERKEPWLALGLTIGQPHVESGLRSDSPLPLAAPLYEAGTRSVVVTLLGTEETPLGLLALSAKEARRYEQDELQLITAMAHLVSAALAREHRAAAAAERERTREDLLRQAQALGRMGAWAMDAQTGALDCERATLALFGLTAETFDGSLEAFLARVVPEDRSRLVAAHRAVSPDQPTMEARYRIRTPDGSLRWMYERDLAHFDDEGMLVRRLGMVMDITEQRQRETALLASEERFRGIFENAAAGIAICDPQGRIVEVNGAFAEMLGREPAGMLGMTLEALSHPDDRSDHHELFERLRTGESPGEMVEKRYRHRNGEWVWVRVSKGVQRDAAGEVTGVICVAEDVSHRRATERSLHEHQALSRMASRLSRMGAWSVSVPDFTLTWSDEVRALHGVSPTHDPDVDEAIAFYAPDSRPVIRAAFERCVADGVPFDLELQLIRADGKPVWVRSIAEAVRDHSGAIVRVQGAFQDITEERWAREALHESEQRFRDLAEHIDEAFFERDLETGELSYVSDAFVPMWGGAIDSLEEARHAYLERRLPTVGDEGPGGSSPPIEVPPSIEYPIVRPNGDERWIQERAFPVADDRGEPRRIVGTMRDVTERRAMTERMRAQAELLDEASDAIIATDREGAVTFWNRCAERMYGKDRTDALGRTLPELLGDHDADIAQLFGRVLQDGGWSGELPLRGDRPRVVRARWTALDGRDEHPRGILAIHSDVTDEKQLQAQFLRAQRLESIGTLAGGIAHDLNNVLTPMLLAVDALREDVRSEEGVETLEQLERSGRRGAALVRQVLTFARGDDGEKQPISVAEQVREVASICRDTFPRSIHVKTEVPDDDWTVFADRTQMHQVLMNLCVNARDAMTDGGELTIALTNVELDQMYAEMNVGAQPGRYTLLTVRDTGIGMEPATLDRIFEPFFSTKPTGEGTGLGLSTSFSIVRDHGGFLHVYSEPGSGTEFKVYLPALDGNTKVESAPVKSSPMLGNGELVLVVEDDDGIRTVTHQTLERFGYRVLSASHGAEAVGIFAAHRRAVAAVFTDMSMPVMDGPATIVALRSMDPDVRIIGTSGLYDHTKWTSAPEGRVDRFIGKPYSASTLLEALHRLIHGQPERDPQGRSDPAPRTSSKPAAARTEATETEVRSAHAESAIVAEGAQAQRILIVDDDPSICRLIARILRAPDRDLVVADSMRTGLEELAAQDGDFALVITDLQLAGSTGLDLAREARARWPELPFLVMSGDVSGVSGEEETLSKPFAPADLRAIVTRKLAEASRRDR